MAVSGIGMVGASGPIVGAMNATESSWLGRQVTNAQNLTYAICQNAWVRIATGIALAVASAKFLVYDGYNKFTAARNAEQAGEKAFKEGDAFTSWEAKLKAASQPENGDQVDPAVVDSLKAQQPKYAPNYQPQALAAGQIALGVLGFALGTLLTVKSAVSLI